MLAQKLQYAVLFAALGGLGFTSCGKKEEETSGEGGGAAVAEAPAEATPPPPPAKATPTDRAAALGFAKYLPADTEGFLGFYDGAGFVKELRSSKLGSFLEELAAGEGIDFDEVNESPQAMMGLSLLKEEFFVAVGKGTPKQSSNLLVLQQVNTFHQMRTMVELAGAALEGGNFDDDEMAMGGIRGIFSDPRVIGGVLETAQMPPVILGCKISDDEIRGNLNGMLAGGLGEFLAMAGPEGEDVAEAVEIPNGDSPLNGVRLVGTKVVAKMREEGAVEGLSEITDAASVERLLKALATKNLIVASGVVDDYLLLFLGSDPGEFKLAESPAQSLVAGGEFSFVDAYLGKKLMLVSSISKPLLDTLGNADTGLGNMARGIKAGLSETEVFGDTQDLEVLLDLVAKQERALYDAVQYSPGGMVLYRDKGYKLEAFGGSSRPDLDLDSEHRFGKLADWEGALIYGAAIGDEEYSGKALDFLDTLGETAYLAAKKISAMDIEDGDFRDFREGFGMFDSMFREDLLRMWTTVRDDVGAGMGSESAMLVDLKGGLPTAPGLAPVLIEEATAPRVAFIAPVTDREKLGEAWKNINGSLENIFKTVSEMSGSNIPMQRPMSSEKDDLTTWFFNIPFQTDDFVFTASLDDDNFYATTSKSFTKELSALLKEGGSKQKGAHLRVNFNELLRYVMETLAVVEKNSAEVFAGNEGAEQEFRRSLPQIRQALGAMSELQDFRVHTRKEGGRVRSSLHLNVH